MHVDDQIYSYYYAEKERQVVKTLEIAFKSEMVLASTREEGNSGSINFKRILGAEVIERRKTTVQDFVFPIFMIVVGASLAFLFYTGARIWDISELIWVAKLIGAVSSLAVLFWLFTTPRYTETEIIGVGILISCPYGSPYLVVPMRPGDAKHAAHILCEIARKNSE